MSADQHDSSKVRRGDFARKKGEVVLREHEYDGIQEFDQKLPNWWLFTFYGAIVCFVLFWVLYYHTSVYQTDQERVTAKLEALQQNKQAALEKALEKIDNESLVQTWASDPSIVSTGETLYQTHCVACHAADLSAVMKSGDQTIPLPGLALNDGEWKFGGEPMDIFKIINEGSPPESKGHNGAKMQAWGQMLTPKEVAEITAFLIAENPDEYDLP